MFRNYYQQQLTNLRERAAEFAQAHPSIAPMLRQNSTDPDIERLLEGSAFLNAIVQEKLDDDLPELIRGIAEILFPHMLRPLPSSSIIAFTPKMSLIETISVPSGTLLSSNPIEGVQCQFRTTMDIEISPLTVTGVKEERLSSDEEKYSVKLRLNGISLKQFACRKLTFFAGGGFIEASQFFARLRTSLQRIVITTGQQHFTLPAKSLDAPGFRSETLLFTDSNQRFSRYSILTEYFMFPEKFLFYEIGGLDKLSTLGESQEFEIQFIMKAGRDLLKLKNEYFTLFAVPAVNLFPMDAEPVQVDHHNERMTILPSCDKRKFFDVYSVDSVTGFRQGTVERKNYIPYNKFVKQKSSDGYFQVHHARSIVNNLHEVKISLSYETGRPIEREVLSVELTCTNAHLAEKLKTGDISVPTSTSPELATFANITAPTTQVDIQLEKNELWRLLSHFTANMLPLSDAESIKELLRMYTFHNERSDSAVLNNLNRIESIESLTTRPVERIFSGVLMRGICISIAFDQTHFSGWGDAYLFCAVLDQFFSLYAPINTFTMLESRNLKTGEVLVWKPRLGEKHLI